MHFLDSQRKAICCEWSIRLTDAPFFIRTWITLAWPSHAAKCRAVCPFESLSSTIQSWHSKRISVISTYPFWAAICKGVQSSRSFALMLAPQVIKTSTILGHQQISIECWSLFPSTTSWTQNNYWFFQKWPGWPIQGAQQTIANNSHTLYLWWPACFFDAWPLSGCSGSGW